MAQLMELENSLHGHSIGQSIMWNTSWTVAQVLLLRPDSNISDGMHRDTTGIMLSRSMLMDNTISRISTFSSAHSRRRMTWMLSLGHDSSRKQDPMYLFSGGSSSGEDGYSHVPYQVWISLIATMDTVCSVSVSLRKWSSPWMAWSTQVSSSIRSIWEDSATVKYRSISIMMSTPWQKANDSAERFVLFSGCSIKSFLVSSLSWK